MPDAFLRAFIGVGNSLLERFHIVPSVLINLTSNAIHPADPGAIRLEVDVLLQALDLILLIQMHEALELRLNPAHLGLCEGTSWWKEPVKTRDG